MHRSRRLNSLLVLFLLMSVIGGALTPPAKAASYKDISSHWAKDDIEFVSGQGIIAGYSDNTFRPDRNVTRAEYIAMINRTFKLSFASPISFSDVKSGDWYAADIGKALAAGYISGYSDGTIRPQKGITRQEAACMIARILAINSGGQQAIVNKYSDQKSIGSWSRDAVAAVVSRGYMAGYPDNSFRPNSLIKRAEAAVVMRAVFGVRPGVTTPTETVTPVTPVTPVKSGEIYNQAGTYGPASGKESISGTVNITASGVILRNLQISKDLLIASSVGSGSVTLKNVTVQGTVTVEGGGPNSVVLENCTVYDLTVNKDAVRLLACGSTSISRVSVKSGASLEESDLIGNGFQKIVISSTSNSPDIKLIGSFDSVDVSASADIALASGSRITTLTMDSAASVTGSGSITNAYINTSGVYIAQTPANTTVARSYTASVGGKTVSGSSSSSGSIPSFSSGYPKTSGVNKTYFDLLVMTNISGRAYYVVLSNGASAPTSVQVKAGENANGSSQSSSRQGSVSLTANTQSSARISGLSIETYYDIYVVAENSYGDLQSTPTLVDVYMSSNDTDPPEISSGYPKTYQVTATTLQFQVKADEKGTAYYVLLPYSSSAPTPSQIKSGTNASGSTVYSYYRGSIDLYADTQTTETISYLAASTPYVLYMVAEDEAYNLQTWVSSLSFTTQSTSVVGVIAMYASTTSVYENVSGGYASLNVTRTSGTSGAASVFYSILNGTAMAGSDYTAVSGTLYWQNGYSNSQTINIPIINDSISEGSETFNVVLSSVSGGTLSSINTTTVTINDDDQSTGTLGFSSTSLSVNENAGTATLMVARTGGSNGTVSVNYSTVNGSATASSDYVSKTGTLSWANGSIAAQPITITINNDIDIESAETFSVVLSGVNGSSGTATVTINNDDLALETPSPLEANQNTAFAGHTFVVTGGTQPCTFAVTAGSLPDGMSISTAGVLSGTPTASGAYNFTLRATDANSFNVSENYSISVAPGIVINSAVLANATEGEGYSYSFTAVGGRGSSYTFSYTGSIPYGMSLTSEGVLTGTPAAGSAGSYSFIVSASDGSGSGTQAFALAVNALVLPLVINPTNPANAIVGTVYTDFAFTASGGKAPYSFAVASGNIPNGMSISSGGVLSGTPAEAITSSFLVTVTDSLGTTNSNTFTLVVN